MKFKDLQITTNQLHRMIYEIFCDNGNEESTVEIEQTSSYSYVVDLIADDEMYNATVYVNFTKTTAQCYVVPLDKMCDRSTWTFNLNDMSYTFTYDD